MTPQPVNVHVVAWAFPPPDHHPVPRSMTVLTTDVRLIIEYVVRDVLAIEDVPAIQSST
jgi:hypothetical protein